MKKCFLVLLILCFLFSAPFVLAQTERTETKLETKGGNIAVIGNAGKANANLIITLEDADGVALQTEQVTTDDEGNFETVVSADSESEVELYTVSAKSVNGDALVSHENISIIAASVNVDGNYLTVSGSVSSGSGKRIGIFVENSKGDMVYVLQAMSDSEGKFHKTFPLSYNIDGEEYTVYIGAQGVDNHSVLTFEYTDRAIETITKKFFAADLSIELSSYVPHLTGTLACSQGKTVNMTITNVSDNRIIATENVTYDDGAKAIDYTLPSLLNPKDYTLRFTVYEGSKILTTINAQVDSAIILTELNGNVTVGSDVSLEVTFSAENANIDDSNSVITEYKEFSASVPNLLSNGSFSFVVDGYEEYTKAKVTDIKNSENPNLYNALKRARPELDSDNNGIITSTEMESIDGILDLSNAGITNLSGIGQCRKVTYLDISGNNLTDIDVLKTMTSLEYLVAHHNFLTDLNGAPNNLRYVDASYNNLTGLMGIKESYNLEVLIANHNSIRDTEGLYGKSNLRHLKLNNNNIDNMDGIADCKNLVHLDFSHNNMNNIRALSKMYDLKYLNFDDNPVESVKELPDNDYVVLRYWADWITDGYIRTVVTDE